ncbi:MAG: hypothetical protein ACPK7O_10545 [Methanobacterium sp.]
MDYVTIEEHLKTEHVIDNSTKISELKAIIKQMKMKVDKVLYKHKMKRNI